MKNKVYVLEFLSTNILGNVISFFTGSKYCHTEMMINNINFSLNWKYDWKEYKSLKAYLKKHKHVHAFEISKVYNFSDKEIRKMEEWWAERINTKAGYGFLNLFTFIFKVPHRKYCKKRGIPYEKKDIDKDNVCAVAMDKDVLVGGLDLFPDFPERCTYPGLVAEKFKKYRVKK